MKALLSKNHLLLLIAFISMLTVPTACREEVDEVAEKQARVWEYSKQHPAGFTININDWTTPTEGICVSYGETQSSHDYGGLSKVIVHALAHDGYVGGWLDTTSGFYYFDSSRLFPENELEAAKAFGKENGQKAIYVISCDSTIYITN